MEIKIENLDEENMPEILSEALKSLRADGMTVYIKPINGKNKKRSKPTREELESISKRFKPTISHEEWENIIDGM